MAVATSTVIAATALAATAVSGYQQYRAAGEAADAQREGQAISQAAQQTRDQQQRRQQIREQRVRRARILQAAENTGVSGGSGAIGSTGALSTLTGRNISNLSSTARASQGIGGAQQRGLDAQQNAQLWGTIGQTSGTIFSAAGGFGDMFNSSSGSPIEGGWQSEVFKI